MSWVLKYFDLPFKERGRDFDGVDCWGLVRLVYQNEFMIELKDLSEGYVTTKDDCLADIVKREAEGWKPIKSGFEKAGDVVVLRLRNEPIHVGIVLDGKRFLHIQRGINAAVESYRSKRWGNRVEGFYRRK